MIQRIQHLFFFLASILMAISFFMPICTYYNINSDSTLKLCCLGLTGIKEQIIYEPKFIWLLFVLMMVSIILFFMVIFLYKNRKLQISLTLLSILIIIVYTTCLFYFVNDASIFLAKDQVYSMLPDYSLYAPFAIIILLLLALRGVKKDEKLIRSVDRLR
jgi:hypothetical protein